MSAARLACGGACASGGHARDPRATAARHDPGHPARIARASARVPVSEKARCGLFIPRGPVAGEQRRRTGGGGALAGDIQFRTETCRELTLLYMISILLPPPGPGRRTVAPQMRQDPRRRRSTGACTPTGTHSTSPPPSAAAMCAAPSCNAHRIAVNPPVMRWRWNVSNGLGDIAATAAARAAPSCGRQQQVSE